VGLQSIKAEGVDKLPKGGPSDQAKYVRGSQIQENRTVGAGGKNIRHLYRRVLWQKTQANDNDQRGGFLPVVPARSQAAIKFLRRQSKVEEDRPIALNL